MWSPTHVQVTVQKASGLLTKGNNNTNDCFVTIALGKVKYQTSVKSKAEPTVEWHEECELPIPDQGNTAEIVLTVLHRNFLGVDEFLGRTCVPLANFDVYERPRNRWYKLESKPGKEKKKERGELEVKISFTVKAGSLTDLSKKEKHKSSIGQLSQLTHSVGGSLLSIGSFEKRKGLRKIAKSIGSKINLKGHKKHDGDDDSIGSSVSSLKKRVAGSFENNLKSSKQIVGDADPGVVSEDDDEFTFDDLSHKSSASSLNQSAAGSAVGAIAGSTVGSSAVGSLENLAGGELLRRSAINSAVTGAAAVGPPKKPPRLDNKPLDEWEQKLYGKANKASSDTLNRRSWEASKLAWQIEEEDSTDHHHVHQQRTNTGSPKNDVKNLDTTKKEDDKEIASVFAKKLKYFKKDKGDTNEMKNEKTEYEERIIIGGENEMKPTSHNNRLTNEMQLKFSGKSKEDLILMVCELQSELNVNKKKLKDLEDYLDDLLLRVMETTPRILQNPYLRKRKSLNCDVSRFRTNPPVKKDEQWLYN